MGAAGEALGRRAGSGESLEPSSHHGASPLATRRRVAITSRVGGWQASGGRRAGCRTVMVPPVSSAHRCRRRDRVEQREQGCCRPLCPRVPGSETDGHRWRDHGAGSGQARHSVWPDASHRISRPGDRGRAPAGRGTHQGKWTSPIGSIPASSRSVSWTATTTLRLRDGRIVEIIGTNWDHLGILQQMGALPATAPRPGA